METGKEGGNKITHQEKGGLKETGLQTLERKSALGETLNPRHKYTEKCPLQTKYIEQQESVTPQGTVWFGNAGGSKNGEGG